MRPTYLEFRSPKEKTPDAYNPVVTSQGKRLGFCTSRVHGTFAQGKRFRQYDVDAQRTGYRLGPGSYEAPRMEIIKPKKGGPVYRPFHGSKDVGNNGYFYIGNSLVFDPSFVLKSRKASVADDSVCVEFNQSRLRPSSARPGTETKSTNFSATPKRKRPVSAKPSTGSPYRSKLSVDL